MRRRFPINLPVTVSWAEGRQRHAVPGVIVEIGSDAVCIAGGEEPPALAIVNVSVEWPVCLEDGCRLRLMVAGRVIDGDSGLFEVAIERYEFRTARRETRPPVPREGLPAPVIPFPAYVS